METITAYKFSSTAKEEKPDLLNGKSVMDFLKSNYQRGYIGGLDNLQRYGVYKIAGWSYDFKPHLKQYLVKQYGTWQEYFAPNKTLLRKSIYGNIQKIVEIND